MKDFPKCIQGGKKTAARNLAWRFGSVYVDRIYKNLPVAVCSRQLLNACMELKKVCEKILALHILLNSRQGPYLFNQITSNFKFSHDRFTRYNAEVTYPSAYNDLQLRILPRRLSNLNVLLARLPKAIVNLNKQFKGVLSTVFLAIANTCLFRSLMNGLPFTI